MMDRKPQIGILCLGIVNLLFVATLLIGFYKIFLFVYRSLNWYGYSAIELLLQGWWFVWLVIIIMAIYYTFLGISMIRKRFYSRRVMMIATFLVASLWLVRVISYCFWYIKEDISIIDIIEKILHEPLFPNNFEILLFVMGIPLIIIDYFYLANSKAKDMLRQE
ncbi:MAG: hypothetical protein JW869_03720 [Candidatus Omnitrophica bacterium]|nr:hypothetical protein [Candidatus Omnitrophota bacterium]